MANACALEAEIHAIGGPTYEPPTVSAEIFTLMTDLACDIVGDCYGDRKSEAHIFLTLHMLDTSTGATTAGTLTSRKIGQIAASYGAMVANEDPLLGSTRWGRLLQLLDRDNFTAGLPFVATTRTFPNISGDCGC